MLVADKTAMEIDKINAEILLEKAKGDAANERRREYDSEIELLKLRAALKRDGGN